MFLWQHREQTCQCVQRLLFVIGNQSCPFGSPMDRGLFHRIAAGRTAGMNGARRSCGGLGHMQAALPRVCCAGGMSLQRCPAHPWAAVITWGSCACKPFVTQPCSGARLAQPVERKALNLVVVGSSPTVGVAGAAMATARAEAKHNPCSEQHSAHSKLGV